MKRVILATKYTGNSYYHYDVRKMPLQSTIVSNSEQVDSEIASIYSPKIDMDCNKIVYMLAAPNEDYFETYTYEYRVACEDAKAMYMDYSCIMCHKSEEVCKNYYEAHHNDAFNRILYIDLMSDAYLGDEFAMKLLDSEFGYPVSSKIEYIGQNCTILERNKFSYQE